MPAMSLRSLHLTVLLTIGLMGLVACDRDIKEVQKRAVTLTVWLHESTPGELRAVQSQVAAFNASQYKIRVNAVIIPGTNYDARIQEASRNSRLPDVIEVEGDKLAQYAWHKIIVPIDKHLTDHTMEGIPPTVLAMGRYGGRFYGVARHVDERVLFARRSILKSLSIRIPDSPSTAWSWREFNQVVHQICAKHAGKPALELPLWVSDYETLQQFFPAIRSAGGALVDRASLTTVAGRLNGRPMIDLFERLRGLYRSGCLTTRGKGAFFFSGEAALLWASSRDYGRLKARYGDDLLVLPLPDFGQGARTTPSGWMLSLTSQARHAQAAMSLIEFLRDDGRLLAVADIAHDLPVSISALADPSRFGPGSDRGLMADLLLHAAEDLPPTPALPLFARSLGGLLPDLVEGKRKVRPELDQVALDLDRKIKGFDRR